MRAVPGIWRLIPAHAGKTQTRQGPSNQFGAHPRSRGENAEVMIGFIVRSGSSPLTRGKLARQLREGMTARLIPAHAGKTVHSWGPSFRCAAHPRSRGENAQAQKRVIIKNGSSPLTRGKLSAVWVVISVFRLIPAHAGKTHPAGHDAVDPRAHPRSRGENPSRGSVIAATFGSSPLTRGKRRVGASVNPRRRLIPAHAGKTPYWRSRS